MALDPHQINNQYPNHNKLSFPVNNIQPEFSSLNNPYEKYDQSLQHIPTEKDSVVGINDAQNNYRIPNSFGGFQSSFKNQQKNHLAYGIEYGQNGSILSERKLNHLQVPKNSSTEASLLPIKSYKGLGFIPKLPDFNQLNSLRRILNNKGSFNDGKKYIWARNTKPHGAQEM